MKADATPVTLADRAAEAAIRAILEAVGHSVTEAASGTEAVEIALSRPFDLILMDCQLPVMDGFDATRAIRAMPAGRATPSGTARTKLARL